MGEAAGTCPSPDTAEIAVADTGAAAAVAAIVVLASGAVTASAAQYHQMALSSEM